MDEDKIYYVYKHVRTDTGDVFYIGKGRHERAWQIDQRNQKHKAIQKKVKSRGGEIEVIIVAKCLSEACAFTLERILIVRYDKGQLANFTKGGAGFWGVSNIGAADKIRATWREKLGGMTNYDKKMKRMADRKAKRELLQKQKEEREMARKFKCANDGKEFDRIVDAADFYGISANAISHVLNGKHNSTKGLVFYRGNTPPEIHAGPVGTAPKPVKCLTNGVTYPSLGEAARSLGLDKKEVARCVKGRARSTKGYTFEAETPPKEYKPVEMPRALEIAGSPVVLRGHPGKPVKCVETQKWYASISIACYENGVTREDMARSLKFGSETRAGLTFTAA